MRSILVDLWSRSVAGKTCGYRFHRVRQLEKSRRAGRRQRGGDRKVDMILADAVSTTDFRPVITSLDREFDRKFDGAAALRLPKCSRMLDAEFRD